MAKTVNSLVISVVLAAGFVHSPAFAQAENEGVVVIRLQHPDYPRPVGAMTKLIGVNAEGKPDAKAFSPKHLFTKYTTSNRDEFLIFKLPAGDYLVHDVFIYTGASGSYCFVNGSPRFHVDSGQALYAGTYSYELRLKPNSGSIFSSDLGTWASRLKPEADELAEAQAAYDKKIKTGKTLARAETTEVTFAIDEKANDAILCRDPQP